ncbi:MAG: hypothetical protein M3545_05495 [Acidobacteriota bacterium]|nr:hypothetical protein [Acidobacteriota bacterium]
MSVDSGVAYTLDASDAIIAVNDAWIAFATANDGVPLLPPAILGRSLWDFIADRTTILLYRRLFERVRAGISPVRFSFRCDAPALRRLLEMSIVMQPAGALRLVVRSVRVEGRPAVLLLDPAGKRSDAVLRMCGWCKRIPDRGGRWMEIEAALPLLALFDQTALPAISHGICGECHRVMMEAADDPVVAASGRIGVGALRSVS